MDLDRDNKRTYHVEFFPGQYTTVKVTNVMDEDFKHHLRWIKDEEKMFFDMEWKPDFKRGKVHQPSIFQVASAKGVLIIQYPPKAPLNTSLATFLVRNEFYGKGMANDRKKLRLRFGEFHPDFLLHLDLDDIEESLLEPSGLTKNFQRMVEEFIPAAPCADFKNDKFKFSNWNREVLLVGQVLYAAFDVLALKLAVPNIKRKVGQCPGGGDLTSSRVERAREAYLMLHVYEERKKQKTDSCVNSSKEIADTINGLG